MKASEFLKFLPEEDRKSIEDWIRVQVEKNTQSYSRFDRFLTFIERTATGAKNAVSGTASWVVETISKIGFHILIANVAYFGLTHGVEWYNGELVKQKQAELEKANSLDRTKPEVTQKVNTTTTSPDRNKFQGGIVDEASSSGEVWLEGSSYGTWLGALACAESASCNSKTEYKVCWFELVADTQGSYDKAMKCWDRACQ